MPKYKPNIIPLSARIFNLVVATLLISYGSYGLYINHLPLPAKRGRIVYFTDEPLWVIYAAIICGALFYLSEIVDHYDKRDNEIIYKNFSKYISRAGWLLFVSSLFLWLYQVT